MVSVRRAPDPGNPLAIQAPPPRQPERCAITRYNCTMQRRFPPRAARRSRPIVVPSTTIVPIRSQISRRAARGRRHARRRGNRGASGPAHGPSVRRAAKGIVSGGAVDQKIMQLKAAPTAPVTVREPSAGATASTWFEMGWAPTTRYVQTTVLEDHPLAAGTPSAGSSSARPSSNRSARVTNSSG